MKEPHESKFGEWINVKDVMPPKNKEVIIYHIIHGGITDTAVDEVIPTEIGYSWKKSNRNKVTDWMHFPQPPTKLKPNNMSISEDDMKQGMHEKNLV